MKELSKHRVCRVCKKRKSTEKDFYYTRGRIFWQCKTCIQKERTKWRRANPTEAKDRLLQTKFKINRQWYYDNLEAQNHVCAICLNPETARETRGNAIRRLAVDHCHKTGVLRGLLCGSCNTGLGKFKDNISYLDSAIKYLKKFNVA